MLKKLLLAACLFASLAGCQTAPTPGAGVTPAELSANLSGRAISESDVILQPDVAMANQLVVVLSGEELSALAGGTVPASELRFLHLAVGTPQELTAITSTDSDGRFAFTLSAGDYILCLADSKAAAGEVFPLRTRGCGQVRLEAGKMLRITVSSGFGEIIIIEK